MREPEFEIIYFTKDDVIVTSGLLGSGLNLSPYVSLTGLGNDTPTDNTFTIFNNGSTSVFYPFDGDDGSSEKTSLLDKLYEVFAPNLGSEGKAAAFALPDGNWANLETTTNWDSSVNNNGKYIYDSANSSLIKLIFRWFSN